MNKKRQILTVLLPIQIASVTALNPQNAVDQGAEAEVKAGVAQAQGQAKVEVLVVGMEAAQNRGAARTLLSRRLLKRNKRLLKRN